MIGYVDSSVLLRLVLGERERLREWRQLEHGVTCELTQVECLRTLQRLRQRLGLGDEELAQRHVALFEALEHMDVIALSRPVVERASQPFPTSLGSLDALHLSAALLWQQAENTRLMFLTHDQPLGLAARAVGFAVLGCGVPGR